MNELTFSDNNQQQQSNQPTDNASANPPVLSNVETNQNQVSASVENTSTAISDLPTPEQPVAEAEPETPPIIADGTEPASVGQTPPTLTEQNIASQVVEPTENIAVPAEVAEQPVPLENAVPTEGQMVQPNVDPTVQAIDQTPAQQPVAAQSDASSSKKWIWIVAGLAIIVTIIIVLSSLGISISL